MRKICLCGFSLALLALAGCGKEDREARVYGPDAARIAGDTAPWQNPPFDGDAAAWQQQTDKRARLLDEYARIR